MVREPLFRLTYVRQWRIHRHLTLADLAKRARMDYSNLSKLERGLLPYSQQTLERLALALDTSAPALLIAAPGEAGELWSLWARANPRERAQIASIAKALLATKGE